MSIRDPLSVGKLCPCKQTSTTNAFCGDNMAAGDNNILMALQTSRRAKNRTLGLVCHLNTKRCWQQVTFN